MADNVAITAGSGTSIATDEVGGAHYQRVKVCWGADGTANDANASTPLPVVLTAAGTVAIGKLGANSGVDIGDVDVTSVPADPFGANADAASATGSISAKLRFIAATGIPVTGTVTVAAHAVTNAGTFAVQDSEKLADDAAFGVASTKVMPIGFLADEGSPDSVDEGDIGAARMTLDRKIHVVVEHETNSVRNSGVAAVPAFVAIAAASSGENTLKSLVSSKKIRVVAMAIVATGAVNIYFVSNTGGTVIFGGSTNKIALAANGGFVLPYNPLGWFETASGENLIVNLSGAVAISGGLVYIPV